MKVIVIGAGLMGPAAAYNALLDPAVERVTLADVSEAQLESSRARLGAAPGVERLATAQLDLSDRDAAVRVISGNDVAIGALHWPMSLLAIRAALRAGVPFVDMAIPGLSDLDELRAAAQASGGTVLLGCGLEPGLTEIVTRFLAGAMDRVDEVHIECGGIPEHPTPPLGYKIVFGGRQLPLRDEPAFEVRNGALVPILRYSGVAATEYAGVGACEAWHEGFMPWLIELPSLRGLRHGTQKTVRWPGYAAKAAVLLELGLLGREAISVDGCQVVPKRLVDTLLYPLVRLEEGEGDITVFRVNVAGELGGRPCSETWTMVDRYDPATGFTSMARTTAFTASIAARMIARREIGGVGLFMPEQLLHGDAFERLVAELAAAGIRFDRS